MAAGSSSEAQIKGCIARVLAGEREAFRPIIEAYQRKIFGMQLYFTRNPAAAEDLTQDVFIAVYESLSRYDSQRSFTNWILRIATNLGLKYRRKKRALPSDQIEISVESEPLAGLLREERQQTVLAALDTLPEEQKLALWLFYFLDKSYAQIAEILDMPLHLVKIRLFRGKKALGEALQTTSDHPKHSCNFSSAEGKVEVRNP